jgi:hypothetical protein
MGLATRYAEHPGPRPQVVAAGYELTVRGHIRTDPLFIPQTLTLFKDVLLHFKLS